MRAIYNTYQYLYVMATKCMPNLDPKHFAYEEREGLLVPSRNHQIFPDGLIQPCNCKACATSRCICKAECISCCVYCNCGGNISVCKNKATTLWILSAYVSTNIYSFLLSIMFLQYVQLITGYWKSPKLLNPLYYYLSVAIPLRGIRFKYPENGKKIIFLFCWSMLKRAS